jgi:hypothetical protein
MRAQHLGASSYTIVGAIGGFYRANDDVADAVLESRSYRSQRSGTTMNEPPHLTNAFRFVPIDPTRY